MSVTDIATTEQPLPPANTPLPDKPVRISKKFRKALDYLATGECSTQRAAAARAGVTEHHLSRMLQKPQIQVFIARESARNISTAKLRASRRFVELIDASSEHVAAKVSERILTSEGILKSDQSSIAVSVDVRAGFVIDLSEPAHMSHSREIEAKPLIDNERGCESHRDDSE